MLTAQQESEIYPLLDRASELPLGKGVFHKCSITRANYLSRIIRGLRYNTAVESILIYEAGSPLHGIGIYGHLWVEPHNKGLLITNLIVPYDNSMWRLIQCAASQLPINLDVDRNTVRQRLSRMQKKYPNIMGRVWLTDDKPAIAHYADISTEELIIVDIDLKPNCPLQDPTHEEIAKSN